MDKAGSHVVYTFLISRIVPRRIKVVDRFNAYSRLMALSCSVSDNPRNLQVGLQALILMGATGSLRG